MGRLTDRQVSFFNDEGYLILNDVFEREDLTPLRHELDDKLDSIIKEVAAEGKITNTHGGESFDRRMVRIFEDSQENGETIMRGLEGKAGGGHCGVEMYRVICHPKLLDVVESLTGPEIIGSSVYRIRPKVPGKVRGVVPWHQDSGYFTPLCDNYLVLTVWIPLVDATARNGCMQILPRAHRQGVSTHHTGGNAGFLVIEDQDLPLPPDRAITAECPLGGVVLMTNLTPHSSTPNDSDIVRWSIDLRYQGSEVPNNVNIWEQVVAGQTVSTEEVQMACYPPEADFVVRSRRHPERVATYDEFTRRRQTFEEITTFPYPKRGWTPVGT